MFEDGAASLTAVAALGAFHGINPGMGWLFAVALGMQERSRRAVLRALLPLGVGHALAIGAAVLVAMATGPLLPAPTLRTVVALTLVGFGILRLFRHGHPRYGGMRVGALRLGTWSFLMASAHGAGLMVLPLVIGASRVHAHDGLHHLPGAASHLTMGAALLATTVHGAGYLAATAVLALLVYEKLGIGLIRRAWLNVDLLWAVALIVTGVATLLV
jgi:hypothetical protein